eukprot:CAMPEP_0202956396 /NCGR_PEP_ID=MMETSP1396-20130829/908_1 /ASSEMBLY_ACC=CAM_ASM_000872 /TAXON_ID= /ORGANISM="Pseudokeronopsis sp., Strain Brazil" /LENGTH=45 /DNA_ID= /DNA_START= /DNA_END= /DNA_ORIENTATION=
MPKWQDVFEVPYDSDNDSMEVRVLDDCFGGDDPIGCCEILASQLN